MLAHLADASIRSLILALLAGAALLVPSFRKTAAFEHAVWAAVVCGMLALFLFGEFLPRLPLPIPDTARTSSVAFVPEMAQPESLPNRASHPAPSPSKKRHTNPLDVALYIYSAISIAFLARFLTGILLVRKLMRTANPVQCGEIRVYESELVKIPCTVGWLRPRILLPIEWSAWSREKLDAVLAHEGAHLDRRDGLINAIARLNRCVFWFHPLAWVLERNLALLAEKACDEFSVATLGDRESYARLLLEFASLVDGSRGRLRYHALTMAAGSHVRQRIDSLLQEGRIFSRGLGRPACAAVALCGIFVLLVAGVVTPVRVAQAQPPAPPVPAVKFDSATVKPCAPTDGVGRSGRGGGQGGRGMGGSPGWFWVTCMSVQEMINSSFRQSGDQLVNDSGLPFGEGRIRGGPDWVRSDYYSVDAETNNPAANEPKPGPGHGPDKSMQIMAGPMLRALLEDRFHLKTHREVEQVPMYALTVAGSGLKLRPMEQGGCIEVPVGGPMPEQKPGDKPVCHGAGWGANGPNRTIEGGGVPLSELAEDLGDIFLDRHVIDQTGITDLFNIHLEYLPDEHTLLRPPFNNDPHLKIDPTSDVPPAPTIFTALEEQLGLKLVSITGPHGFIVIDHVERP